MPGGANRHISLVAHTAIVLPDYLQHSCDLTLYRLATPHYPRSISHTNIDFSNVYDPCVFLVFLPGRRAKHTPPRTTTSSFITWETRLLMLFYWSLP